MRSLTIAAFVAATVTAVPAFAADAPVVSVKVATTAAPRAWLATRAVPVALFDYEDGTLIRPYWFTPWGGRHYFPRTGHKPKVGRRENLAERGRYKPVDEYFRAWSSFPVDVVQPLEGPGHRPLQKPPEIEK